MNVDSIRLLLAVFCFLCIDATGSSAIAQTITVNSDPAYKTELQQNTKCSFITGNNVNIRSEAGTESSVILQLNRGDGVRAQFRQGDWVKLAARVYGLAPNERFEPLNGWVFNQYINGCSEDQFDTWRSSISEPENTLKVSLVISPGELRYVLPTGSTRPIRFGLDQDSVISTVTTILGKPPNNGTNNDCGEGSLTFSTWKNGLKLWFSQGLFVGWALDYKLIDNSDKNSNKLTTFSGIGIDSTLTQLKEVYNINLVKTSLGNEFSVGGLSGILSGSSSNDRVTSLWSGKTCNFR